MKQLIVNNSITINAPALKVWDILTSPNLMKRWMLVVPDFENGSALQIGDRVFWKDRNGECYLVGVVVAIDPPRRFVLELDGITWTRKAGYGDVTYALTLVETENGTDLQLVFGDLAVDPEGKQWFDAYNGSRELNVIKEMAEEQL